MRIAVLGARGQLGAAIVREFEQFADVLPLNREQADITDAPAVSTALRNLRPDAIVNCAGFNDVDGAEERQMEALRANAFAVRTLARSATALDAILVQYSSDFVFDGVVAHPRTEDEQLGPRSVYAMSKMMGEWFAADAPRHYVLRVESLFGSVPGGPPARGSAAGIVRALRAGSSPHVFSNRTVSPTYVVDAAIATHRLLDLHAPHGLYHVVNSGSCTWLEFAEEAARRLGVEPRMTSVRVEDVPLKAPRPQYCALSNEKLKGCGIPMPPWQDALARWLLDGRGSG